MKHLNTHRKAIALREAAHAFAKHDPDLNSSHDENDRIGQRLNAALLDAALEYARARNPDFHVCTACDREVGPRFDSNNFDGSVRIWCSCAVEDARRRELNASKRP